MKEGSRRSCGLCAMRAVLAVVVFIVEVPGIAQAAQLRRSRSETETEDEGFIEHKELYDVDFHFDIQSMDAGIGVTMLMDGKNNRLRLNEGVSVSEGLAWGRFDDQIATTGWSELYIETTQAPVPNDVRAYSAGYVEGVMTCVRMSEFNANLRALLDKKGNKQALINVRRHLRSQVRHLKSMIGMESNTIAEEPADTYWKQVRYVYFQLWGMCDGYNKVARFFSVRELTMEDLVLMNVGGELAQLLEAFTEEAVLDRSKARPQQGPSLLQLASRREVAAVGHQEDALDDEHWERRVITSGKCSALVRLASGNADLFMGHTTWDDYSKMTRVYKYYTMHFINADSTANTIGFSSYPGLVSSTDDFYMMDSGLTVMETSLIILNPHTWNNVAAKPSIPTFMHLMAVNRMARTAPDWAQRFMLGNGGGTYTSQWMIVDYNQFQPNVAPQANTFWMVEAVPGLGHAEDMSSYIQQHGYFASYNRPFFKQIREVSGHTAAEASHGNLYSFDQNPRAVGFKSAALDVNQIAGMRQLMTQNMYPFMGSSAGHAIMARMDLLSVGALPNGGIDTKVTNRCLAKKFSLQAISGPSHQTLPPFRWQAKGGSEVWPGFPHIGQPDVWDFDFVQISPLGAGPVNDGLAATC